MGASALTIPGIVDPVTLEAIACREALALARDLLLTRVTVASDCLAVVNNINQPFAGSYSMVIDEVKEAVSVFANLVFVHENRLSNAEAHRLARFSSSASFGRQVWLLRPPDGLCIRDNVLEQ